MACLTSGGRNRGMAEIVGHSQTKGRANGEPKPQPAAGAPAFDSTGSWLSSGNTLPHACGPSVWYRWALIPLLVAWVVARANGQVEHRDPTTPLGRSVDLPPDIPTIRGDPGVASVQKRSSGSPAREVALSCGWFPSGRFAIGAAVKQLRLDHDAFRVKWNEDLEITRIIERRALRGSSRCHRMGEWKVLPAAHLPGRRPRHAADNAFQVGRRSDPAVASRRSDWRSAVS